MSRSRAAIAALLFVLPDAAMAQSFPIPIVGQAGEDGASAETDGGATAEEALARSADAYGPAPPVNDCEPSAKSDEIVVCATIQNQDQFRYSGSEAARDRYAAETMYAGDPQAPDVAGPGIFRGPATVGRLCVPGLQKCPPPPAITVDFSQLPEAPPGSDADRIARGLAPRGSGYDSGTLIPPPAPPDPVDAGEDENAIPSRGEVEPAPDMVGP